MSSRIRANVFLVSWKTLPESPCVADERRAWSGSNPLSWIPIRGVQGALTEDIAVNLSCRATEHTDAVSTTSFEVLTEYVFLFHYHGVLLRRFALPFWGAAMRAPGGSG